MINHIIRWSIQNRLLVLLATLMLISIGVYSVKHTPVDAIPDLSDVQVIVKTSYPGQAPQVVEQQITYPLTTALLSVPKAKTVRGFSFFGDSYVYVIFDDDVDLYWARSRVLEYLSQSSASLPAGATPQLGPDASGVGWVFMYALIDQTGQHDISVLTSLQNWFLKFELQSLPGVSEVATAGGMIKEYQVQLDPNQMRGLGISLQRIQSALRANNQEQGASVIELAEAEYMIRATGYIQSKADIANIAVSTSSSGTPILLGDIGTIRLVPSQRRGVTDLNGEGEAVGGIIVMRDGENAQRVIEAVKQRLTELQDSLPPGVEVVPVYDRSALIERSVENLSEKLWMELLIVALVCVMFLFHIQSSLVAVISLPIGILAAFAVMHLQGINANIMSLGGIAIAIGAMIDGAIVMVENLHKHIEKTPLTPENRWQVISKAATEVGPALFFSLLIITASFIPVFALEAQEGRLFAPLAFTKTYAMAAAAALAITLVPVLMGYFVRGKVLRETDNPINRLLQAIYRPILMLCMKYAKTTLAISAVVTVIGFWPAGKIGSEFIPPLNEGDLMYMPTTHTAISIGKARELLQQTNKLIATLPEVESVYGKVGRADTATDPAPMTMIETFIQLKPESQWRQGVTTDLLIQELDQLVDVPGLTNAWVMPIKTRIDMLATGIKTPVGVKVSGPDLDIIQSIGQSIETTLQELPDTASVYAERVASGRYLTVDIDRLKIARLGVSIAQVQNTLATTVGGMTIGRTTEDLERYPISVRFPQDYRNSPQQLAALPLVFDNGVQAALGDVADIRIETGPAMIKSESARPNGWVYIDTQATDLAAYVHLAKQTVENGVEIPAGYSIKWSGQYEYMLRADETLRYIVPLTFLVIVILLYLAFKQLSDVLLVLLTLPAALTGGIGLLYLLDFNFSVAVSVGFIALAGVAVEIGVIMLTYLNNATASITSVDKLSLNTALREAIAEGALRRVRPVVMTALSIILGLLPVLFVQGTGSEIMSRIAAPMIGGMLSALLLSLLILPVAYYQVSVWKRRN